MRPWLARLSFSFFIVGGWLLWQSYKAMQGLLGPVSSARIALSLFAAMLCFVMGVVGVRERHRPRDNDGDRFR